MDGHFYNCLCTVRSVLASQKKGRAQRKKHPALCSFSTLTSHNIFMDMVIIAKIDTFFSQCHLPIENYLFKYIIIAPLIEIQTYPEGYNIWEACYMYLVYND